MNTQWRSPICTLGARHLAIVTEAAHRSWPAHGACFICAAAAITPVAVIQSASRTGDILLFIRRGQKGVAAIRALPFVPQVHRDQAQYEYRAGQIELGFVHDAPISHINIQHVSGLTAMRTVNSLVRLPDKGCMQQAKIIFEVPCIGKRRLAPR